MEYIVYVLRSLTSGKMYIGCTNDLVRRLTEHNNSERGRKSAYTHKNTGPWEVIYQEPAVDKGFALIREKQLKSHQGRNYIKSLGR